MLKVDIKYDQVAMKDSFFDETNELNSLLKIASDEFDNLPIDKKWFSIPNSNAAVEKVFFLCKKQ